VKALARTPTRREAARPFGRSAVAATRPIRALAVIALGVMVSGPPSFRLGGGRDPGAALNAATGLDGAAAIQVALVAAAAVTGFALIGRRSIRAQLSRLFLDSRGGRFSLRLLATWVVLAGISIFWSVSPAFTVYSWTRFAGATALYLVVIALGRDLYSIVRFTFWFSLAKMSTILLAFVLSPHVVTAASGRLVGSPLWNDYGSSGLYLTLSAVTLVGLGRATQSRHRSVETILARSPVAVAALLTVAGGYVFASQTRSAMWPLVLFYGMAAYYFRLRLALWTSALIGLGLALTSRGLEPLLGTLTRNAQNPFDVSARDDAFAYTVRWAAERGPFGSGFGAGSRAAMADFARFVNPGMGSAHDGFSSVFADLGFPGTILQVVTIFAILLAVAVGLRRRGRDRYFLPLLLFATFWSLYAIPSGGVDTTSGFVLVLAALIYRVSRPLGPDASLDQRRATLP
jgi:hypothetical protein